MARTSNDKVDKNQYSSDDTHALFADIRRLDAKEIARRSGIDRGRVAKYANTEDFSLKQPPRCASKSMLDEFKPLIDGWLEVDLGMPRRQCHTVRRVHGQLVAEHGFQGSYSTVLRVLPGVLAAGQTW